MKLTIKELATKANISEGTIRAWVAKPEVGVAYSNDNINYANMREKLHKYYANEDDFEKLVGCKIDEVEIVKAERTTKTWLTIDQLEVGKTYVLHNYSLQTEVYYAGCFQDCIHIFQLAGKENQFKALHINEFDKDNIKLESK